MSLSFGILGPPCSYDLAFQLSCFSMTSRRWLESARVAQETKSPSLSVTAGLRQFMLYSLLSRGPHLFNIENAACFVASTNAEGVKRTILSQWDTSRPF